MVDLNNRKQISVILPLGWRRSLQSRYLIEENFDLNKLVAYQDARTGRKYIIDDQSGKRLFLVSERALAQKKKNLGYKSKSVDSALSKPKALSTEEVVDDSNEVIHYQLDENQDNFLGFVDEDELRNIDLNQASIFEDEETNEIYLFNNNNQNLHWIVLPKNWPLLENSPYLTDEDVEILKCEVYLDPASKKRYVIDEKSGKRYYIISDGDVDHRKFKALWDRVNKLGPNSQNQVIIYLNN